MTLSGILKNILLVIASVVIWRTSITALQVFGYGIALAGLTYYSLGHEQLARGLDVASAWITLPLLSLGGRVGGSGRRWILAAAGALVIFLIMTAILLLHRGYL
jgi:hypothetical protein